MTVVIRTFKLPFLDEELAVCAYCPGGDIPYMWPAPVIVMCHGFCGIQRMLLPDIAKRLVRGGFVVVTFDYRGFGDSTGERGRLKPANQQEDIRVVLNWVKNNPALDEERVGLWGAGLGAGHALCVAYQNKVVKCLVIQNTVVNGRHLVTQGMDRDEEERFIQGLEQRATLQRIEGKELWVSVRRLIKDRTSLNFYNLQCSIFPNMVKRMPYLTLYELFHYQPEMFVRGVYQPTFMVATEHDGLVPLSHTQELYKSLSGKKSIHVARGAGRYDIYRSPWQEDTLALQLSWFQAHL